MKNSTLKETIRTGIKEMLEYLAFLRVNEDYVFGRDTSRSEDYFGFGCNGILAIQDFEQETPSLSEQSEDSKEIKTLQASELDDDLTPILQSLLSTWVCCSS